MHLTLATFVLVLCRVVLGTPELIQFLGLFLQNGTWYFVEVQAQARLEHTPDPVMYVNIHDSTVLACTVSIFTIYGKIRAFFRIFFGFRRLEIPLRKLSGTRASFPSKRALEWLLSTPTRNFEYHTSVNQTWMNTRAWPGTG